jgi:hypothetical protein
MLHHFSQEKYASDALLLTWPLQYFHRWINQFVLLYDVNFFRMAKYIKNNTNITMTNKYIYIYFYRY